MMGILYEKKKNKYPRSVTKVLRLEEKCFLQDICYFINNIPKFIKNKQMYEILLAFLLELS
jgi:hypothetical protein